METFSSEELKGFVDEYILSGGGRTRAFGIRETLYAAIDSLYNNKDGGFNTEAVTGYKTELDLSAADARAFVHKAFVLALVGSSTSQVTHAPTIALLTDDANWTNNHYTGPTITNPQKAGDWYITDDYDYKFRSATTVRRIYYPLG